MPHHQGSFGAHHITDTIAQFCALVWQDFEEGKGSLPQDGQQVTFDYTAYNESGSRIDSTYQKGRPAQTRLGINGLIPGKLLLAYIAEAQACITATELPYSDCMQDVTVSCCWHVL